MNSYQPGASTDWEKLYQVVLACGGANNPRSFAITVLSQLSSLCAYDNALVYFLDGNGKVCNQYLMNIDERWSTLYLEYYAQTDSRRFSCYRRIQEGPGQIALNVRDWMHEESAELVPNLIHPRGLQYSCGFALHDMSGNYRTIISLDRLRGDNFSPEELQRLYLIIPQLDNLHKNYFYQGIRQQGIERSAWNGAKLTKREAQIANLLCQGISTGSISTALHISKSTTYKHIANIYEKMHVSSLQELLVRLLNWPQM